MVSRLIVLLSLPILLGTNTPTDNSIRFQTIALNDFLQQLTISQTSYVIMFTSPGCTECMYMEESTFLDRRVINAIKKDYIPIKIDVYSIEGIEWCSKYQIDHIPTIMVIDKDRKIHKYEKVMGQTKLLKVLKEHQADTSNITRKTPSLNRQNTFTEPTYSPTSTPIPAPIPAPIVRNKDAIKANVLYNIQLERLYSSGYGVQVYALKELDNFVYAVEKLQIQYGEPIQVAIYKGKKQLLHKVILGNFATRAEAEAFQRSIRTEKNDHFIVDFDRL